MPDLRYVDQVWLLETLVQLLHGSVKLLKNACGILSWQCVVCLPYKRRVFPCFPEVLQVNNGSGVALIVTGRFLNRVRCSWYF